ncbi:MAG: cell wall metabolism sensor histidine kinase WalK, partial [Chloroflexota bacterium]
SKVNNFQSGKSRVRWHEVDINKTINETVGSLEVAAAEKDVKISIELEEDNLAIDGEEEKIGIAISHLLRNAIAFSQEGGQVIVRAQKLSGYAEIIVKDFGIGIPKQDFTRIFDRFFQVEKHMTRRHGGMGLGLSVAKMMVEMHNGRLSVQSEEGKGSTFTILLPASTEEVERVLSLIELPE